MGARFYDPQSGRFLSPDPLGHAATPDLYSYAGGDPINGIDYDGRINRQTFDLQMSGLWQGPDFGSAGFMDSWTKQLNDWHKEPEWMQPKMSGLDQLQNVLDYVGMVPVIGNVADGLNVVISTLRGNYADAAIRATFMAPGVGIGAAATYKVGKMSYRAMSGRWGAAARKAFTPRPIVDPIINRGGKARGMIYVPGLRFGQRTAKTTGKHSRILRKSLEEAGYARPAGEGWQAGHIVPTNNFSKRSAEVQKAIRTAQKKFDVYLGSNMRDNAINGFWAGAGHAGTHSDKFFLALGQAFRGVKTKKQAEAALNSIWKRIEKGEFQ